MTKTNIDLSNLGCIGILGVLLFSIMLWAAVNVTFGSLLWLAWSGLAPVVGWPSVEYGPFLAGWALVSLALDVLRTVLK